MPAGKYRIADKTIQINSIYEKVHNMCSDYVSDGSVDLEINITEEDIAAERVFSAKNDTAEGKPAANWNDDYLETLAVGKHTLTALFADGNQVV